MDYNYRNYMQRVKTAPAPNYSNMNGNGVPQPAAAAPQKMLGSFARTISVRVVNATNVSATYTVLGYNELGDGASAGSDTGVTITVQGGATSSTSHSELKRQLGSASGIMVQSIKMRTTDADQFNNNVTIQYRDATGKVNQETLYPIEWVEPENQQNNIIRINEVAMILDGYMKLTGTIDAGVTLTFILTVATLVRPTNAAEGVSVVEQNFTPAPSGRAPVQLQIEQPR